MEVLQQDLCIGIVNQLRFDGLAEGAYEILAKEMALAAGVMRSGRLSHLSLSSGEVREDLVLHVGRGSLIRIAVRDGLGPRGNALVTLLDPRGTPLDLFHRSLTDAEGAATFSGVPAGSYRV